MRGRGGLEGRAGTSVIVMLDVHFLIFTGKLPLAGARDCHPLAMNIWTAMAVLSGGREVRWQKEVGQDRPGVLAKVLRPIGIRKE